MGGTHFDGRLGGEVEGNIGEGGWSAGLEEGLSLAGLSVTAFAAVTSIAAFTALSAITGITAAVEGYAGAGTLPTGATLTTLPTLPTGTRLTRRQEGLDPRTACPIIDQYHSEAASAS